MSSFQSTRFSFGGRAAPLVVGREREQASLKHALDQMLAGHGGMVLIDGEAGIGKTTLVEDLSARAEERGALVLWGQAYDLTVTPPYGPWLEILRQCRALGEGFPPRPDFIGDEEALARVGSQDVLFAAVRDYFHELTMVNPLLLVLDDLHWADQASLDFLRFLARQVAGYRLLLLVTYRSEELQRDHPLYAYLPALVRESAPLRLVVQPLTGSAFRTLIRNRVTLTGSDLARLEQYLTTHAEGNPFFAGELLRTLEEEGVLSRDGEHWRLGDLEQVRMPSMLRQVIEGRLSRLDEETRNLLQVAAVIGQDVPLEIWQSVSNENDDTLVTAIEQGEIASLIEEATGGAYRFRHALLREALYEEVNALHRRMWHRRVAEALIQSPNPDPDRVAYHFEQAGDRRVAEWLLKAGERAQRQYVWVTAVARFDAALAKLAEQGAPPVERAVWLYRIASMLRFSDTHRALSLLDEARQLASEASEFGLASFLQFFRGMLQCFDGDVRVGLIAMERGNAALRTLSDADQARVASLVGLVGKEQVGTLVVWLALVGRLEEARTRGARVCAEVTSPILRPGQADSDYADALQGLAMAEALLGNPEAARETIHQAQAAYQATEDHAEVAGTFAWELELVQLPYFPDELAVRHRLADEALAAGRRAIGADVNTPDYAYALPLLILEGEWNEARKVAARTYESTSWGPRVRGGRWLARLAHLQGDAELTMEVIAGILPDGPRTEPGNVSLLPAISVQRLAAEAALDAGNLPDARAWLEAHGRWLDWSGSFLGRAEASLGWARYWQAAGDLAAARQSVDRAVAIASQPRQPLVLMAAYRFLGALETATRQFDDAEAHLEQSIELAVACAAPFERALSLLDQAALRIARGDADEAQPLLEEVQAICEPLQAKPTLARVEALRERLARTGRSETSFPAGLTAREVEVLRLVAEGLTDAEVAERLFLSRRTVSTHLSSVYNKIGVGSRAAATRFAAEHNLI